MFYITAKSCPAFTLAEILIMATMNVKTTRLDSEGRVRPKTAAMERR